MRTKQLYLIKPEVKGHLRATDIENFHAFGVPLLYSDPDGRNMIFWKCHKHDWDGPYYVLSSGPEAKIQDWHSGSWAAPRCQAT